MKVLKMDKKRYYVERIEGDNGHAVGDGLYATLKDARMAIRNNALCYCDHDARKMIQCNTYYTIVDTVANYGMAFSSIDEFNEFMSDCDHIDDSTSYVYDFAKVRNMIL